MKALWQLGVALGFLICAGWAHGAETIYVSKLGDDSNGQTWATAFRTIQQALDAVPSNTGGHRVIVRPDTYMEAMLAPAHKGAEGKYNALIGDVDGALGSGTTGWVVIDSGDPKQGFKSYDWWSTIRANEKGWSKEHTDETFSAIVWDRWKLQHIYATGSDAGLFWDLTDHVEPFTVIVEDCVGIGRAFGGGVAHCLSRADEPIVFRRCYLAALDWWGDTAAAYVRVENEAPPGRPDILFEECTMVSPQCALKAGNFGFTTYSHIRVDRSKLIAMNFSQPQGTPIDGIIQSVEHGKYLHVDLHDTTAMGYKLFGVRVEKESANEISYTTTGNVAAYVQYEQDMPEGVYRLQQWPTEIYSAIAPPSHDPKPILTDRKLVHRDMCEVTCIEWKGRLSYVAFNRPGRGGTPQDYYAELIDVETGDVIARFAEGYGLGCALVDNDTLYIFASRFVEGNWNDVTLFKSKDLKQWESHIVIEQENEHLFNSSVCKGPNGYVMAYESNDGSYPGFTTKFATSADLETWAKVEGAAFGTDRYTACPNIHYADGHYYVLYLERRSPRHFFETYITRSTDLHTWELSSANPVIRPTGLDEGINASDADVFEFGGKTYVHFTIGDQLTWMDVKRATYPGSLQSFLKHWYKQPAIPDRGVLTKSN